jgi:hypothetical protein
MIVCTQPKPENHRKNKANFLTAAYLLGAAILLF